MFRSTFQSGFLSIFYSIGSQPLQLWSTTISDDGTIRRVTDNEIHSSALEVAGNNIAKTFMSCPADPTKGLGVKLPRGVDLAWVVGSAYFVMLVKNVGRYFSFEVEVLDDKGEHRRFRASNYQTTTRVKDYICTMPMKLEAGWNQLQLNLADLTKLYGEDELPPEFKLFLPIQRS